MTFFKKFKKNNKLDLWKKGNKIYMSSTTDWGNSVSFSDFENRRIVGWLPVMPSVGDFVISKMQSGKEAVFIITSVSPCRVPRDMFFADVKDFAYLEELENGNPIK